MEPEDSGFRATFREEIVGHSGATLGLHRIMRDKQLVCRSS